VVPLRITLTPGIGAPVSSAVTLPEIVFSCAITLVARKEQITTLNSKNLFITKMLRLLKKIINLI
jgi:hypothetical protein